MSKEVQIINHFHGNVGQQISRVENMVVRFDKDMNMEISHVENQQKPQAEEQNADCPFVVPEQLQALGTYSMQEFVQMYHHAAQTDAKVLSEFLKKYRDLKVLNLKNLNKKQIYAAINAAFPGEVKFGYRNFATYY